MSLIVLFPETTNNIFALLRELSRVTLTKESELEKKNIVIQLLNKTLQEINFIKQTLLLKKNFGRLGPHVLILLVTVCSMRKTLRRKAGFSEPMQSRLIRKCDDVK